MYGAPWKTDIWSTVEERRFSAALGSERSRASAPVVAFRGPNGSPAAC